MESSCIICNTHDKPFLTPLTCLTKWGPDRSHKICQACWFRDFAKEKGDHTCPGCIAGVPIKPKIKFNVDENKNETINLF